MSKLTDQFRARGVYNEYEFFGEQPYITYYAAEPRTLGSARYMVFKRGVDLGQAWYDRGGRAFLRWGDRREALAAAQKFVTERFGITEFARCPFGAFGDSTFIKARIKEILALPEKK